MKKTNRFFLRHIVDAVGLIRAYTNNVTETQFYQNRLIQDGVLRQNINTILAKTERP
ncbi:hypothetical protein [Desulfococcus multivorans]|uniref:Uncharacterized protein n=1 Tax=Desulfococcus multivorans DSM 2059 TaxID=1121405 RepID=S7VBQ5_DESML|nr:hypothetical protein [Desulfococcus multivorans]AOY56887.1 uncharacterized protein Dmul_01110 [Desulfococcus multivorans]EPR41903.1 hypothetical protein dsmv_1902 [Desulfococcus multivorans DSM 2059]SJZ94240.1 hypothetical protein SAMN02745446_02179 [Desulfococcus multivorans DSM 2059]